MKITILLVVAFSLGVKGSVYSQSVNLSVKEAKLEQTLEEISKQTQYRLLYDYELIDAAAPITVELRGADLETALKRVLKGRNLTYRIISGTITIMERRQLDHVVEGVVTDSLGILRGVTVSVEGLVGSNAVTDQYGRYRIRVPEDATLLFRMMGYEDLRVVVSDTARIDVTMVAVASRLDEVVVVGYGAQRLRQVTGSVATVQSSQISNTPVSSVSAALAGRLPGLIAVQFSGLPGSDQASLNIRGFGAPLVLIDGAEGDLNAIDASEIESISVLKDASAAIYGSRAGNGVVLITTKRGIQGKPIINYNSTYTLQGATNMPKMGSSGMYAQQLREQHLQSGQPEETAPYTEAEIQKFYEATDPQYPNTNWQEILLREWAPQQDHNLSVRGGSETITYYGFLGYIKQEMLWKASDPSFERYNLRANIDAQVTKGLTTRLDFATNLEFWRYTSRNMRNSAIWGDLWNSRPIFPATLPDPTKVSHAEGGGTGGAHITSNRELSGYTDTDNQDIRFVFDLDYQVPFIEGLSAKALLSYIQGYGATKTFQKPVSFYRYDYAADIYTLAGTYGSSANLRLDRSRDRQILTQAHIQYDRTFGQHHLGLQGIYEATDYFNDRLGAARSNFLTPAIDELLAGSTTGMTNDGVTSEMGRQSYIGRLNYRYADRYVLEATLRADASAKFPAESRWGYFPSVLAAWLVDQEAFLKNAASLDALKLRVSYGASGNDNVGNFQYLTGYNITDKSTGGTYILGDNQYPGLISRGLPNPYLTWEKLSLYNAGTDFSFRNSLIYGSFDVFYRIRSGILANRLTTVPSSFGATLPPENINKTNTRGFELVVGTIRRNTDFNWDISANIAWARSKWQFFEEPSYNDPDQRRQNQKTGQWTDRMFGYLSDGLFTSQEEIDNLPYDQDERQNSTLRPGDVKYLDNNGDGVVNWKDQVEIGRGTTPLWTGGLNASFQYKNIDLAILFQGAFGHSTQATLPQFSTTFFENRWTAETNDRHALVPRLGGAGSNGWSSDYRLVSASYVRLKNFHVGYTISNPITNRLRIQRLRIFAAGTNLFTISKLNKYSLDPEGPSATGGMYYPQQRNISLGIDVSF